MRGLLFTEYFDFISEFLDADALEDLLETMSGQITGAYTSVGDYSFDEFLKIHTGVCQALDKDSNDLARQFGHFLLQRFKALYPNYFEGVASGLDFLEKVSTHIHMEVRKLYPTANPPDIILDKLGDKYILRYRSHRPLASVARGLTEACLISFKDPYHITSENHLESETLFTLERVA